jgi:hypothetical protein
MPWVCYYEYVLLRLVVDDLPTMNFWVIDCEELNKNTLAFLRRDFTVKPSVSKGPVCLNRALISRRGDVAVAIICCRVLESVSILHKCFTLSFSFLYCLLTTTIKKILIAKKPSSFINSFFFLSFTKRHLFIFIYFNNNQKKKNKNSTVPNTKKNYLVLLD